MAAPDRADDAGEREAVEGTTGLRPDESGARLRTPGPFEEDDEEELELVEVVVAPRRRAAAIPPPPPRRVHHPERFDLDELLRDVSRAPALGAPALDLEPPTAAPMSGERSRPPYRIAIVVGTTALVAAAITAAALLAAMGSEPAAAPEARQPEIVPPAIVEDIAPAPESAPLPEAPPPVAIAPEPEPEPMQPEPEAAQAARLERRSRVLGRAAAAAAIDEEAATEEASVEAASEAVETEAEEVATAASPEASASPLPERPAREDVDAAVEGVMPALRACGQGLDLIILELHFASSGRATIARTDARHLTPEQRSCLARAARGARVPPFSAPHLSVRYPVRL